MLFYSGGNIKWILILYFWQYGMFFFPGGPSSFFTNVFIPDDQLSQKHDICKISDSSPATEVVQVSKFHRGSMSPDPPTLYEC